MIFRLNIKNYCLFILFVIVIQIILFQFAYCREKNDIEKNRYLFIISEIGAGQYIYAGAGYDFSKKFSLFKSYQYLKSAGFLFGFSYLSEDSVYIYEPLFFITGEILNNKIKIKSKYAVDIDWRLKISKIYVKSIKYNVKGSAFAIGADFLFRTFKYFYFDISLPIVSGDMGTEIAPCIGAGFEYRIW